MPFDLLSAPGGPPAGAPALLAMIWTPYIVGISILLAAALVTTLLIIRRQRRRRRFRGNLRRLSKSGAFEKGRFVTYPGGFVAWGVYAKRTVWKGVYEGRQVEISWTKETDNRFFEYHIEAQNPVVFFLSGWYGKPLPGRKRIKLLGRDFTFDCPDETEERTRLILESEEIATAILELQWKLIERPSSGFTVFGDPQQIDCWKGLAVRRDRISAGECPPRLLLAPAKEFNPDEVVEIFDRLLDIHQKFGRGHATWE